MPAVLQDADTVHAWNKRWHRAAVMSSRRLCADQLAQRCRLHGYEVFIILRCRVSEGRKPGWRTERVNNRCLHDAAIVQ